MFKKIDLWILDTVFESAYYRLFRRFGISNFTCAKYCIMVGLAFMVIAGLNGADLFPVVVFLFLSASALYTAIRQEMRWMNPHPGQLPENFRDADHRDVRLRFVLYLWFLFQGFGFALFGPFPIENPVIFIVEEASFLFVLIGLYFLGCMPPGPREHREREERAMRKTSPARQRA